MNAIASLKRLAHCFSAAGCVNCASAADTNVTHLSAVQAQKLIADRKVVVLDIRTPEEFAAGRPPGGLCFRHR